MDKYTLDQLYGSLSTFNIFDLDDLQKEEKDVVSVFFPATLGPKDFITFQGRDKNFNVVSKLSIE